MKRQEREEIFTAIDEFTSKLHETLDAGNVVAKSLVMILLESCETADKATPQTSNIMTVKEAADYMKVKPGSIYNWVETGQLIPLRAGDDLRFDKTELDAWLRRDRKKQPKRAPACGKLPPTPMRLQPVQGAK